MMTKLLKCIIIILFVVAICLHPVGGSHSWKLYPFGKDVGDLHLPVEDDVSSDAISTPPFWFFGLNVSTLYVSISCDNSFSAFEYSRSNCLVEVDNHSFFAWD